MQALPPPPPAAVAPAPDRSEATTGDLRVAAALTDAQVRVDSSFRGASIVLYGAVFNPTTEPADVVVVVVRQDHVRDGDARELLRGRADLRPLLHGVPGVDEQGSVVADDQADVDAVRFQRRDEHAVGHGGPGH